MAHQYMPKMFHGPTKTLRPPSYILKVRSLILTKFLRIFPASGNLTKWKESRPCRVFLFSIKFWFITICNTNDKKVCLHLMPLFQLYNQVLIIAWTLLLSRILLIALRTLGLKSKSILWTSSDCFSSGDIDSFSNLSVMSH